MATTRNRLAVFIIILSVSVLATLLNGGMAWGQKPDSGGQSSGPQLVGPTLTAPAEGAPEAEVIPGQFIVMLKRGIGRDAFINEHGLSTIHRYSIINGFAARMPQAAADNLRSNPRILSITPDLVVRTSKKPDSSGAGGGKTKTPPLIEPIPTVTASAVAPQISDIPDESILDGAPYTGPTPAASGTQPFTWTHTGPPGMTIDSSTGVVSWPNPAQGTHLISITATNDAGLDIEPCC